MTGALYMAAAVALGGAFLTFSSALFLDRLAHARQLVRASIFYLVGIIAFMIADKALR
jgi:heme O synthase-like polyprenyltransferase